MKNLDNKYIEAEKRPSFLEKIAIGAIITAVITLSSVIYYNNYKDKQSLQNKELNYNPLRMYYENLPRRQRK